MQQSVLGELITLILVIVIMLGGMTMIVGGPSLTGRWYRWIFRTVVLAPLGWGLRQIGRGVEWLLRWSARQLGRLLLYLARLTGRGIHYAWVRLTT